MSWLRSIRKFFYEMLFGCKHGHLTRPFTLQTHSYKVCLDCGRQLPYSLEKMRILNTWETAKLVPQVTELTPAVSIASGYPDVIAFSDPDDYASNQAIA
ncbi:MAG: hypothetical protein ABI164_12055 [Acidobacteriaceae bacterium]